MIYLVPHSVLLLKLQNSIFDNIIRSLDLEIFSCSLFGIHESRLFVGTYLDVLISKRTGVTGVAKLNQMFLDLRQHKLLTSLTL